MAGAGVDGKAAGESTTQANHGPSLQSRYDNLLNICGIMKDLASENDLRDLIRHRLEQHGYCSECYNELTQCECCPKCKLPECECEMGDSCGDCGYSKVECTCNEGMKYCDKCTFLLDMCACKKTDVAKPKA